MDLINPFRICSVLKVLGYFMILLVLSIIALSYYAVVLLTWAPHLLHPGFKSFFSFFIIILFHFLLVLLLWSYLMVVFRDPGFVPDNWKLGSEADLEQANSNSTSRNLGPEISASTVSSSDATEIGPAVRYCSQCQNAKPPRCHHCSICHRCVLKMDHHCIWVVNCVGARNYKFFLLFVVIKIFELNKGPFPGVDGQENGPILTTISISQRSIAQFGYFMLVLNFILSQEFYTFLETTLNTLVLLPSFINYFQQAKNHSLSPGNLAVTFLAFVLNLAFALSLLCFVSMHTSLLLSNTTSVEVYEKKKSVQWKYDLGRKRNFEQVFGTKKMFWFFPLFSEEDLKNIPALHGLDFPTRSDMGE